MLEQSLFYVLGAFDRGADGVQPQLLVCLGALWVIDAGHHARHLEDVLGDLRRHDVAIVAFGDSDESVGVLDTGAAEDLGVGAVADDLVALEVVGQDAALGRAGELVGVAVDDGDVVAVAVHLSGDPGADASAADDHDLQRASIIGRASESTSIMAVRFPFTFLGLMAIAIGLLVPVYLAVHPGLDPLSVWISYATALGALGFGAYVLVRRWRRGPDS